VVAHAMISAGTNVTTTKAKYSRGSDGGPTPASRSAGMRSMIS
jgi:hypothetical protein